MFALTTKTRSTEFFEGNRVNHLFHCPLDFAMECSSPWIKQSPLHHRLTFLLVHPRHDLWWFTWHIYIQNRVLDLGYEHIFPFAWLVFGPTQSCRRAVVPSVRRHRSEYDDRASGSSGEGAPWRFVGSSVGRTNMGSNLLGPT